MATRKIICAFIFAISFNLILTVEDTDYQNEKDIRVVGRAYSLTGCSYENQAGYTCLTCHRALHCYLGGAAIMVDCYGLFRYCRDGRCSRKQGAKCFEDTRLTTAWPETFNVSSHIAEHGIEPSNTSSDGDAPVVISTANDVK